MYPCSSSEQHIGGIPLATSAHGLDKKGSSEPPRMCERKVMGALRPAPRPARPSPMPRPCVAAPYPNPIYHHTHARAHTDTQAHIITHEDRTRGEGARRARTHPMCGPCMPLVWPAVHAAEAASGRRRPTQPTVHVGLGHRVAPQGPARPCRTTAMPCGATSPLATVKLHEY